MKIKKNIWHILQYKINTCSFWTFMHSYLLHFLIMQQFKTCTPKEVVSWPVSQNKQYKKLKKTPCNQGYGKFTAWLYIDVSLFIIYWWVLIKSYRFQNFKANFKSRIFFADCNAGHRIATAYEKMSRGSENQLQSFLRRSRTSETRRRRRNSQANNVKQVKETTKNTQGCRRRRQWRLVADQK